MEQDSNPVIPATWEFLTMAIGAAILALAVAAVISLARDKTLAPGVKLLCLLGILAFPVLGPAAWFFHRYRSRRARTQPATERINRA